MPHRESSAVVFTGEMWGQAWGFMLRADQGGFSFREPRWGGGPPLRGT